MNASVRWYLAEPAENRIILKMVFCVSLRELRGRLFFFSKSAFSLDEPPFPAVLLGGSGVGAGPIEELRRGSGNM